MALSTARKKANAKYEAKAYDKTLIRLPKGRLDEIRAHIEPVGESLNGFIGRAINETMARDSAEGHQEAVGAAKEGGGISIYPDTLKRAQEAAERTGEDAGAFMARAVKSQAKRDEKSLAMGINPAAEDGANP